MSAGPVLGIYLLLGILALGLVVGLGRLLMGRATAASNGVFIVSGVLLVAFALPIWPLLGLALLGMLVCGIALMALARRKG